jgi:hypothetical protein
MKYATYYVLIFVGAFMAIGTFLKLIGVFDIDSDLFWLLAGCGLVVEGFISYVKQKKFDRKYRIIERK